MYIHNAARQTGKSTKIADQLSWCYTFDILPVCVIFPNHDMMFRFKNTFLEQIYHLTHEALDEIHLWSAYQWPKHGLGKIYKRIYIDEAQIIGAPVMDELRARFDDKVYAYGTGIDSKYALPLL